MKVTMTSSAMNGVYDYYYDSAMNSILGGTMTMTVNGKTMTISYPRIPAQSDVRNQFQQGVNTHVRRH